MRTSPLAEPICFALRFAATFASSNKTTRDINKSTQLALETAPTSQQKVQDKERKPSFRNAARFWVKKNLLTCRFLSLSKPAPCRIGLPIPHVLLSLKKESIILAF